jgi:hypothetical protein
MENILYTAGAVITSLGGGVLIVLAFSTWLGKVWANRFLEKDKLNYQTQMEELKADLNRKIHEYNVAASRIDGQRAEAIQVIYACLIEWFEAALQILAPNELRDDSTVAIPTYRDWAVPLRDVSIKLQKLALQYTILLTEDTYEKLRECGESVSKLSLDFYYAVHNTNEDDPEDILNEIENARSNLDNSYQKYFAPAKDALITEFRSLMDPKLKHSQNS